MGISAHLLRGEDTTLDWPLTSVPPLCAQNPSNNVMLDARFWFWWDDIIKFWLRQTICLLKQWKTGILRQPGRGVWLWSHSCKLMRHVWLSCRSDLLCSLWHLGDGFMPSSVYSLLLSGLVSSCKAATCLYQRRAWTSRESGGRRSSTKAFWSAWEGLKPAR